MLLGSQGFFWYQLLTKTGPFKGLSKGTTRVFGFALRFAVTQPSGATARAKDGKGSNSSEHFLFIPKPKALNPHDSIGLLLLFFFGCQGREAVVSQDGKAG